MPIPSNHFYVRSRKDAFPDNAGAHPLISVKLLDGIAVVASCSLKDRFSKAVARKILDGRQKTGQHIGFSRTSHTLADILKLAGVPRKLLQVADMARAEVAFERALEA